MNIAPLQGERHRFAIPMVCMQLAPFYTLRHVYSAPCTPTVASSTSIRTSTSPSPAAGSISGMASGATSSLRSMPWRKSGAGAVIRLLRHSYDLINPGSLPGLGHIRDKKQWQRYLQARYGRRWKVHFAKKTRGAWRSVRYLGRYLMRPPVSAAKLRHYSGGAVVHHYYDHRTQQYRQQTLSQEDMIGRYISHIPAKHFKMVRYYGFLSNRKRGELLPKVYDALAMEARKKPEQPGFAALMKEFLRMDPYKWQLSAFYQRTGRQTRVGTGGRKAACDRQKTMAAGTVCRVSASEKWV